jgi:hypothetical protein
MMQIFPQGKKKGRITLSLLFLTENLRTQNFGRENTFFLPICVIMGLQKASLPEGALGCAQLQGYGLCPKPALQAMP